MFNCRGATLSSKRAIFLLLVLASLAIFSGPQAKAAETNLVGTLVSGEKVPVPGVKITIRNDSTQLGSTTTDSQGNWSFPVTNTGYFWVKLDVSSLPEGLALTEGTLDEKRVNVLMLGFDLKVIFPIGQGVEPLSTFEQTAQLLTDGAILGLIIALAALGLNLVYGTTGLTNFAHGELLTLGGLLTYFLSAIVGVPVIFAVPLALILVGLIGGYLQNKLLWKPLRARGTGLIAMLVISIGFAIFIRYFYLFIFGGDTRQLPEYAGQAGLQFGDVFITPKSIITTTIGALLLVLATLWLLKSKDGKASRAVADNPSLASASGVEVERVIRSVWILGSILAGYAGIIITINQGVSFLMGQDMLLLIFAAVTLGGLGTANGAVIGSMIMGIFIQLSTLVIPTELKYVGALVVLILILLVRPQGILGKKDRVG
jgi:branched-chain amino acid transport system permease protein